MAFEALESTDPEEVGPYRLLARLGAGGMGRVYLARSSGGRTVAVKVVRAELAEDADFRERFRREVAAAQAVSGPYTAPVVDADRDGPVPWLATAYVLGPSLTEAVAAHGPLPVEAVRALGTGLGQALAAVHGAGMVHRDLKPSNVLLAADGPRVIDFGIARALDGDRMTTTGVVVGSPGFMSPEQASGKRLGPPSDVFSLGSILVFAATGAGPFENAEDGTPSAPVLLYRVVHDEPDLSGLPAELRPAVSACLAKDPADRPTPAELAALLGGDRTLGRGGWLPAPVTSDIATHAATVMDMETPARGTTVADPRAVASGGAPRAHGAAAGAPSAVHAPTEFAEAQPPADGTPRFRPRPAADGSGSGAGGTDAARTTPGAAPASAQPARPSRRGLLVGGAAALVAAGGGGAWLLTRHPHKPGPNPPPSPTTSPSPSPTKTRAPGVPPVPLWTYRFGSLTFGDPMVRFTKDLVVFGGDDLIALNLSDGKEAWVKKDAPASHYGMAGGTISYGLIGNLYTVDTDTGAMLWKWDAPQVPMGKTGSELSPDTVLGADEHTVYAMCSYIEIGPGGMTNLDKPTTPGIMAVTRKEGKPVWDVRRNPTADPFVNGLLVKDVLVYTDSKQNLVARSTADGHQLWFVTTDSLFAHPPVTDGDRVYCSAEPNGLQAVNLADGKQSWVKTIEKGSGVWHSPPAVGGGVVYAVIGGVTVNLNGAVHTPPKGPVLIAYQATDGKELWRLDLPNEAVMDYAPALVKDTLFVGTAQKGVHAIDIRSRKIRWTFVNGITDGLPWQLFSNDERVIAVQGDRVYALPPE